MNSKVPSAFPVSRRSFIRRTALAAAAWPVLSARAAGLSVPGANARIRVGVMGLNGRGQAHLTGFMGQANVEIAYVCDVDSRAMGRSVESVTKTQSRAPKAVTDFRRILDDPAVDVLAIAAPNHWHAPATILACNAGKHVYVEKPGSHTAHEAQLMAAAARRHRRVVQLGNQRRSWPWVQEAIHRLHAGEIGKVQLARTWYNNARGSIGRGKRVPIPDWLDFTLWQGPAPERPYVDNLVHYNWHWRWHWGGGELANNGVHALDIARWGLRKDYPSRVSCGGGRYSFDDDQETPDIYITTFDYDDCCATWESQSCHPRGFEGEGFGIHFHGERGSLLIAGNSAKILDPKGKMLDEISGPSGDKEHFADFCRCIRENQSPNSDIADCHKSALLCHLGNIAYRTAATLEVNPANGAIRGNRAAQRLWTREYRRGWQPRI